MSYALPFYFYFFSRLCFQCKFGNTWTQRKLVSLRRKKKTKSLQLKAESFVHVCISYFIVRCQFWQVRVMISLQSLTFLRPCELSSYRILEANLLTPVTEMGNKMFCSTDNSQHGLLVFKLVASNLAYYKWELVVCLDLPVR